MTDYEEYDLTGEDGEDSALNFTSLAQFGNGQTVVPGLLKGAIIDAEASEPYARNGLLHIPSGEIEGTTTPTANSETGRYGVVVSVQPSNAWGIDDGHIYVGAANAGSAGVISSANFKALQGKTPTFTGGALNLPLAQAPTDTCNGTVDDDTPGGIVGIGYSEDGDFRIEDGYARIPRPPESGYFPDGLYNAATGEKITWQTFLAGTSPVPLSEPAEGLRIMAFHLGKYLTFYLERV
jgi:hypothetical protein